MLEKLISGSIGSAISTIYLHSIIFDLDISKISLRGKNLAIFALKVIKSCEGKVEVDLRGQDGADGNENSMDGADGGYSGHFLLKGKSLKQTSGGDISDSCFDMNLRGGNGGDGKNGKPGTPGIQGLDINKGQELSPIDQSLQRSISKSLKKWVERNIGTTAEEATNILDGYSDWYKGNQMKTVKKVWKASIAARYDIKDFQDFILSSFTSEQIGYSLIQAWGNSQIDTNGDEDITTQVLDKVASASLFVNPAQCTKSPSTDWGKVSIQSSVRGSTTSFLDL